MHDEDRVSYISATDYKAMLSSMAPELGHEHDDLLHNRDTLQSALEGQRVDFSNAQAVLQGQVADLEAELRAQEAEVERLRAEEGAAARERDHLHSICQQLQQQVCPRFRLCDHAKGLGTACGVIPHVRAVLKRGGRLICASFGHPCTRLGCVRT